MEGLKRIPQTLCLPILPPCLSTLLVWREAIRSLGERYAHRGTQECQGLPDQARHPHPPLARLVPGRAAFRERMGRPAVSMSNLASEPQPERV